MVWTDTCIPRTGHQHIQSRDLREDNCGPAPLSHVLGVPSGVKPRGLTGHGYCPKDQSLFKANLSIVCLVQISFISSISQQKERSKQAGIFLLHIIMMNRPLTKLLVLLLLFISSTVVQPEPRYEERLEGQERHEQRRELQPEDSSALVQPEQHDEGNLEGQERRELQPWMMWGMMSGMSGWEPMGAGGREPRRRREERREERRRRPGGGCPCGWCGGGRCCKVI